MGNKGAGYTPETSLRPAVGNGAGEMVAQPLRPAVGNNGTTGTQKQVTFGDRPTVTLLPKAHTVTTTPTPVGPETSVGKLDKYHEEIWMSGALIILKGETPKHKRQVVE